MRKVKKRVVVVVVGKAGWIDDVLVESKDKDFFL